jgi:hypothetical protein
MSLDDELAKFGSEMSGSDFEEVIQELHAIMHPAWTFEQLLYNPSNGNRYCEAVRARAGKGRPDEMILRRLNNIRKKGRRDEAA